MSQYMRVSEVAKKYAINPATVRRWLINGKLKAIKVGRQHRILETDMEAFLISSAIRRTAEDREDLAALTERQDEVGIPHDQLIEGLRHDGLL